MHIGQKCRVYFEHDKRYHKALIHHVNAATADVIWCGGEWDGQTSEGIHFDYITLMASDIKEEMVDIKTLLANNLAAIGESRTMNSEQNIGLSNQIDKINTMIGGYVGHMDQIARRESGHVVAEIGKYFTILDKHSEKCSQDTQDFMRGFHKMMETKLDGVATRLDKLNDNLRINWAQDLFSHDDDEVNYNMDRLKASLNSLGSVHMYSRSNSPNVEEVRRYTSAPELPVFGNYNKKQ